MNFSSKLIEDSVNAFSSLPGIGKKSALRLVLYLVQQNKDVTKEFVNTLAQMRERVRTCNVCFNIADSELCAVCANPRRDASVICVVSTIREVMAIEDTSQFKGLYHVLGGVISPIEGVGPQDLHIDSLLERAMQPQTKEIIMAITPTIEGDTTIYYLSKKLMDADVRITTLARGISFGGELEYADEITLGRSIITRTPYKTGE